VRGVSTPTRERVEATQAFAAAATEAERALAAALTALTEAAQGFQRIQQPDLMGIATFNSGRLSTLLDLVRPMADEYREVASLYRRVGAAEQSERDAHLELYGEEAR
jgi:hypothetical protein